MEIIHADSNNFKSLIDDDYVLVDFFATWCGPCQMLSPVLEKIKDKIKIVKVDIDELEDITRSYGVMSVPTLMLMKKGEVVDKKVGFIPEPLLINWIDEEL